MSIVGKWSADDPDQFHIPVIYEPMARVTNRTWGGLLFLMAFCLFWFAATDDPEYGAFRWLPCPLALALAFLGGVVVVSRGVSFDRSRGAYKKWTNWLGFRVGIWRSLENAPLIEIIADDKHKRYVMTFGQRPIFVSTEKEDLSDRARELGAFLGVDDVTKNLLPTKKAGARRRALAGPNAMDKFTVAGRARKKWWRFWYTGQTGKSLVGIFFPLVWIVFYLGFKASHPGHELLHRTVVLLYAGLLYVWLPVLVCWLIFARRYLVSHGLDFQITDQGLLVSAPLTKTLVPWRDIIDIFPDTASPQFVVCTKRGQFYIPQEMEYSDRLFLEISESVLGPGRPEYDISLCEPLDQRHASMMLIISVPIIAVFSYSSLIIGTNTPPSTMHHLMVFGLALLEALLATLFLKKPTIIRVGEKGIFIRDFRGDHSLSWPRIRQMRKVAKALIRIETREGTWLCPWRLYFLDSSCTVEKADQTQEKLLQLCTRQLGARSKW